MGGRQKASAQGSRVTPARPAAKRLVCVGTLLGFYAPEFFGSAADPRLLRPLDDAGLTARFTTLSGLDHGGPVGNGHDHAQGLYTGTVGQGVSLDQLAAPALGRETRSESLQLSAGTSQTRPTLSFSSAGVPMPAIVDPAELFARLFGGGEAAQQRRAYLLESGGSLLDDLGGEARRVAKGLGAEDRRRLDEYLTSLRGLECRLDRREAWLERGFPEPPADLRPPTPGATGGSQLLETEELMWNLMALALQTDATRVLSLSIPITFRALLLDGELMDTGYHGLSHHGNDPKRIEGLLQIEERHMRGAARFLATLARTPDPEGGSLLDSTVVLIGSGMGNAATHQRRNLPLLVAGGGLRHRGHLSCATEALPNLRACDLFVTVLRRLGIEAPAFSSSAADLDGELT